MVGMKRYFDFFISIFLIKKIAEAKYFLENNIVKKNSLKPAIFR